MPILLLRKRKLRHSLGRPSRSDFVQREFIEAYVRHAYAAEFLVTIEGADKATTLYYSQTGVWFDEQGEPYKVVAWMPLPEVFRG